MQMRSRSGVGRVTSGSLAGLWRARTGALVAVFVLVLAACGGGGAAESTDTGGGTDTGGEASPAGDEPVELTVWAARPYYVPPDQFQSLMEEYPNIKITWDVQAEDDILQQLQRMKDAGQKMPDVIQDDPYLFAAYNQAGLLRPIDDVVERWEQEDPESFNLLPESAWGQATLDGQIYGMSPATTFDQVYYNIPWLEEAGVQLPFDSLEDIFDAAMALKQSRPDEIPFSVQALAGEGVTALKAMFNVAGVPYEGATPQLTSEAGIYVIDWYQRMQQNELLPADAVSWGEAESRVPFLTGEAGLMIDSLSTAFDYVQEPEFVYGEDWGVTLLPLSRTGDAQDGNWRAGAKTWAVTSDTEHPYEASLVLRYIADTDNLVESVLEGAVPPRQTEAIDDPRINEVMPFFSDDLKEALLNADPLPVAPNAGEVESVLEQLFGEIVTGTDVSAQELAEKYQQQLDAL
jgi:multiple sugar transport system substrate-binding protein